MNSGLVCLKVMPSYCSLGSDHDNMLIIQWKTPMSITWETLKSLLLAGEVGPLRGASKNAGSSRQLAVPILTPATGR